MGLKYDNERYGVTLTGGVFDGLWRQWRNGKFAILFATIFKVWMMTTRGTERKRSLLITW